MSPRLVVAGVIAAVFTAGLASGAGARRLLDASPDGGATSWDAVVREMDLTAEQAHTIDSLFAAYQPKTDSLLLALAPRLRSLADSMDAELLPLLTPSQRDVLARAQRRQIFLLRLKTPQGERVDTLRLEPDGR